ncbi:hypothetical protein BKP35_16225 [Anaerobacillus arseniciselenatis]|uniref:Uncharacterized protein n=1 Tax=Anaerobacillus arseniciselenatis TaxID=85682 RepID=A0A1S2LBI9_9BACI|nr:hypothetical protein [Anaerobacillus arseniciselenatis]OIJ09403.1 hypothetical protein BKP35_16225 [Anaerobacillus arseniciselenatis]
MKEQLKKTVYTALKLAGLKIVHHSGYLNFTFKYPCPKQGDLVTVGIRITEKPTIEDICTLAIGREKNNLNKSWLIIPDHVKVENLSYYIRENNVKVISVTEFLLTVIRDLSYLTVFNTLEDPIYTFQYPHKVKIPKEKTEIELYTAIINKYTHSNQIIANKPVETYTAIFQHFNTNEIDNWKSRYSKKSLNSLFYLYDPNIYKIDPTLEIFHKKFGERYRVEYAVEVDSNNIWVLDKDYYYNTEGKWL